MSTVPDERIRVICVDDSADFLHLLSRVLCSQPDIVCVAVLERADTLVADAVRLDAEVVVLDLTMPGLDPMTALRDLTAAERNVKVIVMSGYDDPARIDDAIAAGAAGFVSKGEEAFRIADIVRQVYAGSVYVSGSWN